MTHSLIKFITNGENSENFFASEKEKIDVSNLDKATGGTKRKQLELEKKMAEHVKNKEEMEKQKRLAIIQERANVKINADAIDKAILKAKTSSLMEKIFKKRQMPKFAIYSRLDKNLLK
jgi:hypothetical protein